MKPIKSAIKPMMSAIEPIKSAMKPIKLATSSTNAARVPEEEPTTPATLPRSPAWGQPMHPRMPNMGSERSSEAARPSLEAPPREEERRVRREILALLPASPSPAHNAVGKED